MKFVTEDRKTVICPECYVQNHFDEPVTEGQVVLCRACRVRIKIVADGDSLNAVVLPDETKEEDKTW